MDARIVLIGETLLHLFLASRTILRRMQCLERLSIAAPRQALEALSANLTKAPEPLAQKVA
jgi:hypothetical protein